MGRDVGREDGLYVRAVLFDAVDIGERSRLRPRMAGAGVVTCC